MISASAEDIEPTVGVRGAGDEAGAKPRRWFGRRGRRRGRDLDVREAALAEGDMDADRREPRLVDERLLVARARRVLCRVVGGLQAQLRR